MLIAVLKPGVVANRDTVLGFLRGRLARWWIPDDVRFVAEIPHTAAGKINKLKLREQFRAGSPRNDPSITGSACFGAPTPMT